MVRRGVTTRIKGDFGLVWALKNHFTEAPTSTCWCRLHGGSFQEKVFHFKLANSGYQLMPSFHYLHKYLLKTV